MSDGWLLTANRTIQRYFIALLVINLILGFARFFFPFLILETGGSESLISSASALFAVGQITSFLLLRHLVKSERWLFLAGSSFYATFMLIISFSDLPWLFTVSRLIEGLGTGLLFLLIIKLANQFESNKGEALGLLFAASFLGTATGQGIAGLMNDVLIAAFNWSLLTVIHNLARSALVLLLITAMVGLPARVKPENEKKQPLYWSWQHFHLLQFLKRLFKPDFILLIIVYIFYDFAHGLYTPNLAVLLNRNGIDLAWLGIAYFAGDFAWGITQVYSGRIVDKHGHVLPLVLSLLLKGIAVLLYPAVSLLAAITFLLVIAGIAEGFLEPARNKAALETDELPEINHSHEHLLMAYSSGAGFQFSSHEHLHSHELGPETAVSLFQTAGIISFAAGSIAGSVLLEVSWSLEMVTWLGASFLFLTGIVSAFTRLTRK
ncbi:MAG: MFS transporter [Candidatus Odinarchaeota archaeon]